MNGSNGPDEDARIDASALLAALGDAVIVCDEHGTIRHASEAIAPLLGWPPSELVGKPLQTIMPARMQAAHERAFERFVRTRTPRMVGRGAMRVPALCRDGSEREVDVLLRQAPGDPLLVVAGLRDAAASVPIDRFLEEQTQRRAAQDAEQRLAVQYRVARALVAESEVADAVVEVLRAFGEGFGWETAAFWRWHEDERLLRCAATWVAPGVDVPHVLAAAAHTTFREGDVAVGAVFHDGRALFSDDVTDDRRFGRALQFHTDRVRAGLLFPVTGARRVGVMEFYRRGPTKVDDDLLTALAALGSQLGLYLEGRAAADRLRESEQWLTTTLRSISDAVVAADLQGRVTFLNPEAERLTGLAPAEAVGRPIDEVVRLSDGKGKRRVPAREALEEDQPVTVPDDVFLESQNGARYDVDDSAAPIRTAEGRTIGVVVVLRDATRRRRAEARRRFLDEASLALAGSLDYRDTLAAVARLAVPGLADWCTVDLLVDGKLEPVALAHADPSKIEWARRLSERFPIDMSAPTGAPNVSRTGASEIYPDIPDAMLRAAAKDEEQLSLLREVGMRSAIVVPLAAGGPPLGTLSLISSSESRRYDAEDLAMAEELGRRAGQAIANARLYRDAQEAIRARDEFLSIASHELKTPLTSLQLQIQSLMLRARGEASEKKLDSAHRQIVRLTRLINQLLDLSRVSVGQLALDLDIVDLARVVHDAVARLAEDAQRAACTIAVEPPPEPDSLLGRWDRLRLDQVVTNLVANAIKYGAGRPVTVRLLRVETRARLEVVDEGVGVKAEDRARIFDRFERAVPSRHYGGLGLGLYIVRQIVQAHGGVVGVEPNASRGSRFYCELPLAPPD